MANPTPPESIETRLFINGEFVESSNGKTFDVISPKTLEVVARVAAAKAAQPAWAALTVEERAKYFKKLAQLVREHNEELAALEAMSMGVPRSQYFHAFACASIFDHFAEAGYNLQGSTSLNTPGFINTTLRQPYGVVAALIPWNVPLIFFANKIAPALAVGNTVVLKSSEKAPLTSARVAGLIKEAGFPPGFINVITGFGNPSHGCARTLLYGIDKDWKINPGSLFKIQLKGSLSGVGREVPAVIFEDADLEAAVSQTQHSVLSNSGQVCMANTRVYVQDTIAAAFIEQFKKKFSTAAIMGNPSDPKTNHGPQADRLQHENVRRYIEIGKKEGTLVLGGEASAETGYFINPTIFTNAPEEAKIMKEEIFGPVVVINTFKTEEEVLAKAKDTEYGLYASVFTKNIDRALRFARGLEAGTVGVNCTSPTTGKDMPFGGYKGSGIGREGLFSG